MSADGGAGCRACGEELPLGARFCLSCGTAVSAAACSSCGELLPANARFCSACGLPVAGAGEPSAADRRAPVSERRVTSVLFGDLVGFTPLSERLDSDDVRELLSRYFSVCRDIITSHGGTVDKFIGDAVMGVWGVPLAHEDDATRAVRAGLELVQAVHDLGPRVGAPDLAMRVGVVTGETTVTLGATGEGLVAGDSVNTASRVQSIATPGQVWTDEITRALTSGLISYADAGVHDLKGKSKRIRLWHAESVATAPAGERVDGLHAPLTGRDSELQLIIGLFDATVTSGRPRLVIVGGEAGTGKSRLGLGEFEKYVDSLVMTVWWHQGRCPTYGDGTAFRALAEAFRTRLGLLEGQEWSLDVVRLSLARFVPEPAELDWLLPRIAALAGLATADGLTRESLFDAWTMFLERLAATSPVVLVIDDAQHADEGLLAFLEHLLAVGQAPILVMLLARPGLLLRRPDLGGRRSTVVHLDPLPDHAMTTLVNHLVAGLPPDTCADIVARAEGVPLYAVEIIRTLLDAHLVVPLDGAYVVADGAVVDIAALGPPASLQAIITARLDALDPDERRLVADASVLGLSFPDEALAALGMEPTRLRHALESLQRREILALQQDRHAAERGQYRFVQASVRQVAYGMLAKRDRKARHLAAAEFLEAHAQLHGAGDNAVVIAQHLMDAAEACSLGDADEEILTARACDMLVRAAQHARELGAPADAWRLDVLALERSLDPAQRAHLHQQAAKDASDAGLYDEAILHGETVMADPLADPVDIGLAAAWTGWSMSLRGENEHAVSVMTPQLEALESVPGSEFAQAHLARAIAMVTVTGGSPLEATDIAERLLLLAEGLQDAAMIADAQVQIAVILSYQGANDTAECLLRHAGQAARQQGLLSQEATAMMVLGAIAISRHLDAALAILDEAASAARRAGVSMLIDWTLVNRAIALWALGQLDDCSDVLDVVEAQATDEHTGYETGTYRALIDDARGNPIVPLPRDPGASVFNTLAADAVSLLARQSGPGPVQEPGECREVFDRLLASSGLEGDFEIFWTILMLTALEARDVETAQYMLDPVEAAPPGRVTPALRGQFLRMRGLLGALRGDDPTAVEEDLRSGLQALTEVGMALHAARARAELGRWLIDQGRTDEGDPLMAAGISQLTERGAHGWSARLGLGLA